MLLDNSPLVLIILTTASTIFDMSRSEPDGLMDFMKKDKKIEKAEPEGLGLESLRVISDNNNNRKEASSRKIPQLQNGVPETNNIETDDGLMNFMKKSKKSETNDEPNKNLKSFGILSNAPLQNGNLLKIPKLSKVHHIINRKKQEKSLDQFNKMGKSFSLNELDGLQGLKVMADAKENKKSSSTESTSTMKQTTIFEPLDEITEIIPTEEVTKKDIEDSTKKPDSKESRIKKNSSSETDNTGDHRLHHWEDKNDEITTQMTNTDEDTTIPATEIAQDSVTDLMSPTVPEEKDEIEEVLDENEKASELTFSFRSGRINKRSNSSKILNKESSTGKNLAADEISENSEKTITEIIPNQGDQVIVSSSNENSQILDENNAKNAKLTVMKDGRPHHESIVVMETKQHKKNALKTSEDIIPFSRKKEEDPKPNELEQNDTNLELTISENNIKPSEERANKLECIPCSAKHIRCNDFKQNNTENQNAKITVMKNDHPRHQSLVVLEQKQGLEREIENDQDQKLSDPSNMLDEHFENKAKQEESSKL